MTSDFQKELRTLVQLNSYQLTINIMPFDQKYSEFIHYGLSQIEDVYSVRICLHFNDKAVGNTISERCSVCNYYKDEKVKNPSTCLLVNDKNFTVMSVQTGTNSYGYIALELNKNCSKNIISSIRNFVNFIAINIENMERKNKLEAQNKELNEFKNQLEKLVIDRTSELENTYQKLLHTKKQVEESEEKYRFLFENMSQGVVYHQKTGEVIYANEAAANILGLSQDQLTGKTSFDPRWKSIKTDNSDLSGVEHPAMVTLRTGKPVKNFVMGVFVPEKNRYRWININSIPRFKNGELYQVVVTFENISKLIKATEMAEKSEEKFRKAFITNPEAITINRLDTGIYTSVNQGFTKILEYSEEDVIGKTSLELGIWLSASERENFISLLQRDEVLNNFEARFMTKSGKIIDCLVSSALIEIDNAPHLISITRDISNIKKLEEENEKSYSLLKNLAGQVPGVIYQYQLWPDGHSAFPYSSPGIYDIYEVTPQEVQTDASPVFTRLHPDDLDYIVETIYESAREQSIYQSEFRVILPEQGLRWRYCHAKPQLMEDGSTLWHGVITDITDRKMVEQALLKSQQFQEAMITCSPVALYSIDHEGKVLSWNESAQRIFGWNSEEIIGAMLPIVPEIYTDEFKNTLHEANSHNGFINKEVIRQRKDGSLINISLSSAPLLDENNESIGILSAALDITKIKELESEKEKALVQRQLSQKLETIGTLAGGIAHDFNNILMPIIGYSNILKNNFSIDNDIYEGLNEIYDAGLRGKELTTQILNFSRSSDTEMMPLQLSPILKEAIKLLNHTKPAKIEIQLLVDDEASMVLINGTKFHQVIMNLCTNAIHAIEDNKGLIKISLKEVKAQYEKLLFHDNTVSEKYIKIQISDNGSGIPQSIISKIFDPFYTTKEQGKGTGLGLSVVHGIIKEHNGLIFVESQENIGTSFTIFLPTFVQQAKKIYNKTASLLEGTSLADTKILVLDDRPEVARLTTKMLSTIGCKVYDFTESSEALDFFKDNNHQINIVFTDYSMPQMSGVEFANKIWSIKDNIPIIIASGNISIIDQDKLNNKDKCKIISKPILLSEVTNTLNSLL